MVLNNLSRLWPPSFVGIAALLVLCGCDDLPRAVDFSVSAQEGRDVTTIFGGCGEGFQDGYLFCRHIEGVEPKGEITMHFPEVSCDREACIEFQFFNLDGSPGFGGAIDRGDTRASVPLHRIVGHKNPLSVENDDGEYQLAVKVYYSSPDGLERQMRADGLLRLWVFRQDYQRLFCNDPERGWSEKLDRHCRAEFSTGYRSTLCGECEPEVK